MHLVSAIPTLNHVRDIKGYCLLLMEVSKAQGSLRRPDRPRSPGAGRGPGLRRYRPAAADDADAAAVGASRDASAFMSVPRGPGKQPKCLVGWPDFWPDIRMVGVVVTLSAMFLTAAGAAGRLHH
ncbi:hypothetical protein DL765_002900 [Monosporascus sp. GIB2]|nr:hypothetical protein DL765_002900 [Monosporascus sp. GIB2]